MITIEHCGEYSKLATDKEIVAYFQHCLIRKVLAHPVGVLLNLQLGRPPLDLDGLLAA